MTHILTILVTSASAITGWEIIRRWFEKRKRRDLKNLVRDALPQDPSIDSPRDRELREALR